MLWGFFIKLVKKEVYMHESDLLIWDNEEVKKTTCIAKYNIIYFAIQNMFKYSVYHHAKVQMMQRLCNRRKNVNFSEGICNQEKVMKQESNTKKWNPCKWLGTKYFTIWNW